MESLRAFSNEQEEVEQKGLPISNWLGESDENMTKGDKSKNTQKTVKAKPVKPDGVKGVVKVKNYIKIPSNWTCAIQHKNPQFRGKCIVKDNPANEKDVFKSVEDCMKKTECTGYIDKYAKETLAKPTKGRVTSVKAVRTREGEGTPVKMYLLPNPEPDTSKLNKRKSKKKSKKRKTKRRKSRKRINKY
jgi:hypothetical protein